MFSEISRDSQNFHGPTTWFVKTLILMSWIGSYFPGLHSAGRTGSTTTSGLVGVKVDVIESEMVSTYSQGSGLKLLNWDSSDLLLGRMDIFDEIFIVFYSGSVSVTDLHFRKLLALHVSLVIWYLQASPKAKAIKGHLQINKSCQQGTVSGGEWAIPVKNEQNVQSCLAYFWVLCLPLLMAVRHNGKTLTLTSQFLCFDFIAKESFLLRAHWDKK